MFRYDGGSSLGNKSFEIIDCKPGNIFLWFGQKLRNKSISLFIVYVLGFQVKILKKQYYKFGDQYANFAELIKLFIAKNQNIL